MLSGRSIGFLRSRLMFIWSLAFRSLENRRDWGLSLKRKFLSELGFGRNSLNLRFAWCRTLIEYNLLLLKVANDRLNNGCTDWRLDTWTRVLESFFSQSCLSATTSLFAADSCWFWRVLRGHYFLSLWKLNSASIGQTILKRFLNITLLNGDRLREWDMLVNSRHG